MSLLARTGLLDTSGLLAQTGLIDQTSLLQGATPDSQVLHLLTTEASATPTATLITLAPGETGLRLFSGPTPASERYFDLYVSKSGGAVTKVRLYRWQGRILKGVAGDTFALGTTDGRTLVGAPMSLPTSLTAPSGVTGTVNCDKACPSIWSPSAGHVILPSRGSTFTLNSDGTERVVFISEKSPTGEWTSPRWVFLQASTSVRVLCNYTEVAIANYAGATLSVTAPTGSTVGGAKATMSLTFPAITGTTHSVSTVAAFKTAIAAAVSGDEIVLAAGTYALDVAITRASFVANEAAGKKGLEGIVIRGATGTRSDVVLSGTSGTNGGWTINMPGAGAQMGLYGYIRDLTFDFGALATKFSLGGGKYKLQNLRWTGGTGDTVDFNATNYPITVDALYCRADTSGDDCINLSGDASYNATSRIRLIDCEGIGGGNNANSQCLTSHLGLPFETYGGTYSDAHTSVVANDATSTPGYMFFSTISAGARAAGITNGIRLFACTWTGGTAGSAEVQTHFSRLSGALANSTTTLLRNTTFAEHNIITVTVGRAIFNSIGAASLKGNIFVGPNECIRLGSAAGAVASTDVLFNTFASSNIGFSSQDVSNMPSVFKNNASSTMSTSVNVVTSGTAAVTGDYNTIDPTVDVDYSAGANDLVAGNAALSLTTYLPTASGNVDGNGLTSLVDYVGDSDPYGYVQIYKADRVSRGARDIPAIYSGAVLHPEFW